MIGYQVFFSPLISLFIYPPDITHPIPDLKGYITEGQIYVDRQLHNRQVCGCVDMCVDGL